MRQRYTVYVIQIGHNREVLYVNFSLEVSTSFKRFIYRQPHVRDSVLRPQLAQGYEGYRSSRQANRAALRLIDKLEKVGYEVIAGGPLKNKYWQTYVIELGGDPMKVYVGETNYPRQLRFQQHVYGFNCGRQLWRIDILRLADELCDDQKYLNKEASLKAEAQLAKRLRAQGYRVWGGH